jgi:predicted RNA methylase
MYKKYVLADLETLERAYDVGAFYRSRHKKALMDVSACACEDVCNEVSNIERIEFCIRSNNHH